MLSCTLRVPGERDKIGRHAEPPSDFKPVFLPCGNPAAHVDRAGWRVVCNRSGPEIEPSATPGRNKCRFQDDSVAIHHVPARPEWPTDDNGCCLSGVRRPLRRHRQDAIPNFGLTSDAIWVHLALANPQSEPMPFILHLDAPTTSYVDLHTGPPGLATEPDFATGARRPFSTRPFADRVCRLPLDCAAGGYD